MKTALRAGIPPFYVMDVWLAAAERQRTHGDLVNMSAGQPSAGAPVPVRAAAMAALDGPLGYTVALGTPELRTAIAESYRSAHGLDIDADDVVVTTGSSGGFLLAFLACFDAGDRVAVTSPGYPCYRNILTALGCEVVELPCGPDTRFQPTADMLAAVHPPVDGVIVASPANPTGTVIAPAELAAIATWCAETGVRLISDEVYHGLVYPGAPQTSCAWSTSRDAVVVNSFSKYFAMTGWRLGWMVVPKSLQRAVDRLTGNFTICPPVLSQQAAVAAFSPEAVAEADGHLQHYGHNRERLLNGLRGIGIDKLAPTDGAFYVYADVSHLTDDSLSFCAKLLAETGVAIAPGIDFDPVRGGSYVRLSFAGPTADVDEAVARIGAWIS
ncbi:aminotransferase [Mycolicibacterium murale]|uniref:Aminotransferase n=1 Tax=Mycolicibacterium murale TaxID=182220 RepID=A0A7I9WYI8_9MYCO|nr:aminotransferase [Mycolicibacterium murale]